jgi:hypothetical protein
MAEGGGSGEEDSGTCGHGEEDEGGGVVKAKKIEGGGREGREYATFR